MSHGDTYVATFVQSAGESEQAFGDRLRALAADLTSRQPSSTAVALVADGHPEIPAESFVNAMAAPPFSGLLLISGTPPGDVPGAQSVHRVRPNVIRPAPRGSGGSRTPGVTLVLAINREPSLSFDEFVEYWAERHSQVHLRCSPSTARYEQLVMDEPVSGDAVPFDGIGVLAYSSDDLVDRMFADADAEAELFADVARLVDQPSVVALAVSEYVYGA
jgi:hypothetical protein